MKFALILVFGVWLNPNLITDLEQQRTDCRINMVGDVYKHVDIDGVKCDDVAQKIREVIGK